MATVALQRAAVSTAPAVVRCYDLLDAAVFSGFDDLTDGRYADERNDRAAYLQAQAAQAEYLLDQVECEPGSRVLDLGCGYGRILEHAAWRSAEAVGITISPPQVVRCRERGLDARLLNYRSLGHDWDGRFDCIIANGSLEHFVQAEDAAAGRGDAIYQEMFAICRRLLAPGRRLATTAIHFREPGRWRPDDVLEEPGRLPVGSDAYQFAALYRNFGGWYPEPGQLERCAAGHFRLINAEDGTLDYHRTSEYWLRQMRRALMSRPRLWLHIVRMMLRYGRPALEMTRTLLVDQSWNWQFRGKRPPMILWRHTWEAV